MIEGKEMNMDINQSRGRVKTNEQRLGLMKWNMNLWIKSVESKISSSFFFSGMNREYGIRVLTGWISKARLKGESFHISFSGWKDSFIDLFDANKIEVE